MSESYTPPPYTQPHVQNNVIVVQEKNIIVAYILWFFLGGIGGHRFYLNSPFMALCQMGLNILGWLTILFFIGYFFFFILGLWLLFDIVWILFRTGHLHNKELNKIASRLS